MDSVAYYSIIVAMARVLKESGAWGELLDEIERESECRKIRIERLEQDGKQSSASCD